MGCGTARPRHSRAFGFFFQYPLRAYGLWNFAGGVVNPLKKLAFSTLCGPMGCGTH